MPPLISTGAQLFRARERLGLTQVEMAAALGYIENSYQRLEAGRRKIHPAIARLVWMYETHGVPQWEMLAKSR